MWPLLEPGIGARNLPEAALVRRTWAVSWSRLAKAPQTCGRPYSGHAVLPHGFRVFSWTRDHEEIRIGWGDPSVGTQVAGRLRTIMLQDRWSRIAQQECAAGAEDGLDWRRILKGAAKKPLVLAGLRLLWQGAVRRADHGGDVLCQMCGNPNSWRHALHDCRRWAAGCAQGTRLFCVSRIGAEAVDNASPIFRDPNEEACEWHLRG